tara:strand:- start:2923 stop:3684 length:762 start_codon:yes stop_codon:yes gene_type:complete
MTLNTTQKISSRKSKVFTHDKKFNTLKKFVCEMSEFFQDDMAVKLYNHLLCKTTIKNRAPVKRHVKLFEDFCIANREQIVSSDPNLSQTKIEYSSRVYLDFSTIFSNVSNSQSVLFDHLLVLSMVFDPDGEAVDVLKTRKGGDVPAELHSLFSSNPFLADMMEKVEGHVKPGANPMEAMSSMMSSGLLQELVSGMQENIETGDLDMGELMESVQKMTAALPPEQMQALTPIMKAAALTQNTSTADHTEHTEQK